MSFYLDPRCVSPCCNTGPKHRLDETITAQPALFVANLAAFEVLKSRDPAVAASARAIAGLSLGEYSALVAAGAMSFRDGLKVVKARGEAMAAAAATPPGGRLHGMLSIVGLADSDIQRLCDDAKGQLGNETVCQLANFLFPQGRVVSGHTDALDLVSSGAANLGALKVQRLAVSGAFHTRLMEPARARLQEVLATIDIQPPRIPVISNVTATPFPADPTAIRDVLGRQLVEPVRWEETLTALLSSPEGPAGVTPVVPEGGIGWHGCSRLYELGPGHQIKAMVRRLSQQAWRDFTNIPA
eukprot:GHRR01018614.1.p1 GENE.GHRR01018614.1~~GHRR01018614.1.p1  ORF type:complete len:299 (+),score=88.75 GHRR01018614.1:728-1624(+)